LGCHACIGLSRDGFAVGVFKLGAAFVQDACIATKLSVAWMRDRRVDPRAVADGNGEGEVGNGRKKL
jgi:hypothetical protein